MDRLKDLIKQQMMIPSKENQETDCLNGNGLDISAASGLFRGVTDQRNDSRKHRKAGSRRIWKEEQASLNSVQVRAHDSTVRQRLLEETGSTGKFKDKDDAEIQEHKDAHLTRSSPP